MSAAASPVGELCPVTPADVAARVRRLGAAVPAALAVAGAAASFEDPRLGLLAGAVVLGWTRLVGL